MSLSFKVNGTEILEGLRFINKVKKGPFGQTDELMIGSYPPSSAVQTFRFPKYGFLDGPKGMIYR